MVQKGVSIVIDQNIDQINNAKNYIYDIFNNPEKVELIKENYKKIKVKNSNSLIYKIILNEK